MTAALGFITGITGKIGIVLTVMAALTATAIGVAIMVFNDSAARLAEMDDIHLPALHATEEVIVAADALRDGLANLILARNARDLEAVAVLVQPQAEQAAEVITLLPDDDAIAMMPDFEAVRVSLESLIAARHDEFAAAAAVDLRLAAARTAGETAYARLADMADLSYAAVIRNGKDTIAAVDAMFGTIMDRDLDALRLVMAARADVNLLSGVALALLSSRDAPVAAMFADLGRATVARLDDMVQRMKPVAGLEPIATATDAAQKALADVLSVGTTAGAMSVGTTAGAMSVGTTADAMSGGTTAGAMSVGTTAGAMSVGTTADAMSGGTTAGAMSGGTTAGAMSGGTTAAIMREKEVMALRQSVETSSATVQDDLVSALDAQAENVRSSTRTALGNLLGEQVARLRVVIEMRSETRRILSLALEAVIVPTREALDAAERDLGLAGDGLSALMKSEPQDVRTTFAPLIELASVGRGIVAAQRASLDARQTSAAAGADATKLVDVIAADARAIAEDAEGRIELANRTMRDRMAQARQQMLRIAAASAVLLLLAPLFTWFAVVRPLLAVTHATERLATGDLAAVDRLGRGHAEIGRMTAALSVFRDGLIEKARLEVEERANHAAREDTARIAAAERAAQQDQARAREQDNERRERERVATEHAERETLRATAEAERLERQAVQEHVVRELAQGLGKLADGDLRATIAVPFGDGYDQLRLDFNAAVETLEDTIGRVQQSVNSIHAGSGEISNATDDLSRRTEQTAATLEQSAAALTELTASVTSAAAGAAEADTLVATVRQSAARSSDVVNEAVNAMGEIENSSRRISKITDVIDDIAFQTNLLALNAGVEAARAGEAGRGFAVVASEVRALAQRSSEAAREINSLISESGVQVSRGVDRVDQVGRVLREIVASIAEVSGHVAAIAASTREQSSGISEINTAISQLDQTTQQNAAMVEETTAASHTLTEEASTLSGTISRFVLAAGSAGHRNGAVRRRA